MPTTEIGMPTGASSNMPISGSLDLVKNSLTTILVEVLTSDTELVTIDAKESGIRYFDGLAPIFLVNPRTTGIKKAVVAVLLMKAPSAAAVTMMTGKRRCSLFPA